MTLQKHLNHFTAVSLVAIYAFYNQVLELNSTLAPEELLSKLQNIEIQLGRERFVKWGSRTIDIDILYFGGLSFENENLSIPHSQIQNRRFTLVPMNEIAPDFIHPTLKKSQSDLLDICEDSLEVIKTQWN